MLTHTARQTPLSYDTRRFLILLPRALIRVFGERNHLPEFGYYRHFNTRLIPVGDGGLGLAHMTYVHNNRSYR